ncbi:hypothetical protein W02_24520 [Nitrospira sp. KM1]|uniref:hypothetical protein n=1 Tax=Nitrospira sp. KM1 TaxID=1936990 RepID=UPI0013A7A259|nr:hypothetical protein [Nitrospira sp. KM1]BCA55312.1 hypothetical protein W02_24520 [Nitrospira sp. KM1]
MGNWLTQFLAEHQDSLPDIPDIVSSVSGLSGPDLEESPEISAPEIVAPLRPGWLVAYRDRTGKLRGGFEERAAGTIQECRWEGNGWVVDLTNGESLPASIIQAVGRVNAEGRIIAAWSVRHHGLDGEGSAQ